MCDVLAFRTISAFYCAIVAVGGCSAPASDPTWSHPATSGSDAAADAVVDTASEVTEAIPPAPLRIVTWNTRAFADDVQGNCECYAEEPVSSAVYQQKVTDVSSVLANLAGDIVVLQEVENPAILEKLASTQALASFGYQYRYLLPSRDPKGLTVGFMSRLPVDSAKSHKDDSFTRLDAPTKSYQYAHDALEIHMTVRGKHLVFFGVHFKAKVNDDPERRLAEAQHTRALADIVLRADPSAYLWILGDYNDGDGTGTYLAVQNGMKGPAFEDAMGKASAADRYSYVYQGTKLLIDHMFASPNAAPRLDQASVSVLHGKLPSDHSPIAATYQVP